MRKTIIIVLAVIGGLSLVCVGGMVVGGFWLAGQVGPPEGITVSVEQPPSVRSGETFQVVVTVANALPRGRVIKDIDLHGTLPQGLAFVSAEPAQASFDPTMGFWTITMNHPLDASAEAKVTLTLTAGTPGVYSGDFDVSVDTIMKINTTPFTITVDPAQ